MVRLEEFAKKVRHSVHVNEIGITTDNGTSLRVYDNTSAGKAFLRIELIKIAKEAHCFYYFSYDVDREKVYMFVY